MCARLACTTAMRGRWATEEAAQVVAVRLEQCRLARRCARVWVLCQGELRERH
jgi:hypothetical protein